MICYATCATLFQSVIDIFVDMIHKYFSYGLWACLCVLSFEKHDMMAGVERY